MWNWLRKTWGERQLGAVGDLVWATGEVTPDWREIQIERGDGGSVVLSVTGDTSTSVSRLSLQ